MMSKIPNKQLQLAPQAALMRLQLYATGRTHEILNEAGAEIMLLLSRAAGRDGAIDMAGIRGLVGKIELVWGRQMRVWATLVQRLRWEAAGLGVGLLAEEHRRRFRLRTEAKPEPGAVSVERGTDYVFRPQLRQVVEAAAKRTYTDGVPLSGRVWRLNEEGMEGIRRILYGGLADGRSAWDMAKDLEQHLGSGQDCPRWTSTRLYKLSKKEIAAGDRRGLKSGTECEGQGVAYKALRLARNEIQVVHHMASDALMADKPWVRGEKIALSGSHPTEDICDEVANGGKNGDGVYPVGSVSLPLHVQCLCYKTAEVMGEEEFLRDLRAWTQGERAWPAMDDYAARVGAQNLSGAISGPIVDGLEAWLFGDAETLAQRIEGAGDAG